MNFSPAHIRKQNLKVNNLKKYSRFVIYVPIYNHRFR